MSHTHCAHSRAENKQCQKTAVVPWLYLFYGSIAHAYFRRVIKFGNRKNTLSSTIKHVSQSENVCVQGDPISFGEGGCTELLLGFAPALFSNLQRINRAQQPRHQEAPPMDFYHWSEDQSITSRSFCEALLILSLVWSRQDPELIIAACSQRQRHRFKNYHSISIWLANLCR